MELYIYNAKDKTVIARVKKILSFTDSEIVTEDGVYSPLSDGVELSATADCAGTLRADWRRDNPTAESRMEALEVLVAELLFGGSPADGGEAV